MNNDDIDNEASFEIQKLLKDANLHDAITDISQITTNVPIIGTLVKLMKFTSKVQEEIFAFKIKNFLFELKNISIEKRREKIDEINNSKNLQYSIGLVILDQLQRIEINYKPTILGKLFASYINEEIDIATYMRLAHIISNAFYLDIKEFIESSSNGLFKGSENNSLINSELMHTNQWEIYQDLIGGQIKSLNGIPVMSSGKKEYLPEITALGKLFLNIINK
ncbi:MAG: hypothetical protein HXM78_04385 [Neisseria lactamica]|nr:hypothetical protein [Neisseria lactamica]